MGCGASKPAVDGAKPQLVKLQNDDGAVTAKADGAVKATTLNGKEDGLNGKELDGHAEEQEKPARVDIPHGDEGLAAGVAKKVEQAEEVSVQACAYRGAPIPTNEKERHETLCACNILDSTPDPRFDDITKLLCSIFRVPIAIVSLVDTDRQWFKSIQGLPVRETDRSSSFCAWTLLPKNPEVLIVNDATQDDRFMYNPLVTGAPHIRFYAGAPLVTSNGMRLGSLCVIDTEPRHLDAEQLMVLANFAEVVVREIEKDMARKEETDRLRSQTSGLIGAMDCFSEGIMLVNTKSENWDILFVNDAWSRVTGYQREDALGKPVFNLFEIPGTSHAAAMEQYRDIVRKHTSFTLDLLKVTSEEGTFRYSANFRPASTDALDINKPIGIPGMADWPSGQADQYYFVTVNEKAMMSLEEPIAAGDQPKWAAKQVGSEKKHPWEDVELGPLIGQGSFGKVYRGVWNGAPVAVKIIHMANDTSLIPTSRDAAADPEFISGSGLASATPSSTMRGALEAMHSVDLGHPNIVQTYKSTQRLVQSGQDERHGPQAACGQGDELPVRAFTETWLVLEFCDKGNLQDAVDRGVFNLPRLPGADQNSSVQCNVRSVRETALEIASALAYLHDLNILHGDLAGGNILLTTSNKDPRKFTCKVADFGLSRVLSQEAISTGTFGTVTHMPPELLTTGRLSKSVDVYAFGVLLWEMCTGRRPWAGMMQMQVIFHVTIQNKTLDFPESVPEELRSVGQRCMRKDPDERPIMKEVVATLNGIEY